jgi:hypothetical protein
MISKIKPFEYLVCENSNTTATAAVSGLSTYSEPLVKVCIDALPSATNLSFGGTLGMPNMVKCRRTPKLGATIQVNLFPMSKTTFEPCSSTQLE